MRKPVYLMAVVAILSVTFVMPARAQYSIILDNYHMMSCAVFSNTVMVSGSTTGLSIRTVYGDGTSDTVLATNANPVPGHTYIWPGTYTVKVYLFLGSTTMDSLTLSVPVGNCSYTDLVAFHDLNSNCILDPGEVQMKSAVSVEVDSSGIPVDTLSLLGEYGYYEHGPTGTIYTYKYLSSLAGMVLACPAGGNLYDTVSNSITHTTKYFAFQCVSGTSFDVAEQVSSRAGSESYHANIEVSNDYCVAQTDTLTMVFSPKYVYSWASPTPFSVTGNIVKWSLPSISIDHPQFIGISCWNTYSTTTIHVGDTLHSSFVLTYLPGDVNSANNTINRIDTAKSSYDPNFKSVSPQGIITAGTILTYSISFENTGNDTAHNIYIMDTLSANVDARSLTTIAASANVTTILRNIGGMNIVKFDFPNINLLDSSHHGQCDGVVTFTVNTFGGLPDGTEIFNHAGIFFDDNPVVMTDTVENIIGIPTTQVPQVMDNKTKVSLYPNPSHNQFTLQVDGGDYSMLSITNTIGQEVLQQSISARESVINTTKLAPGLYYVILRGGSGVKTLKFEKQ